MVPRTSAAGISSLHGLLARAEYHSHAMAGADLHRGTYTGQYGFLMVESGNDAGHYDQEIFLALRDWEPYFTDQMESEAAESGGLGPPSRRPKRSIRGRMASKK